MADQKRWFKLWCSAPSDDDLLTLPPDLRWAWAVLGCYTKEHGTAGRIKLTASNVVLAAQMAVPVSELKRTILMLPHVRVEEGRTDNGEFTVTWQNWIKYQEDSTVAERVARLRSKRRGDEKRRDEKRSISTNGVQADAQFLDALKANPAYEGIDFDRELGRMDAWLSTPKGRGRHKTRQFVVNWLNKIDRPLEGRPMPHPGIDLR